MTPPILGLRTVIYKVPDMKSARDWYGRAFRAEPYFSTPGYTGFSIGGYELGLLADDGPQTAKAANVLTYWGVDDIDAELERLTALGAAPDTPAVNVGGDIRVATVRDPWDNVIGLIYNPEFGVEPRTEPGPA